MEGPHHEVNTSSTPLLNSTLGVHSLYLDDSFNFNLEQEQFYEHKISSLESDIKSLAANQILIQSQPIKLVDNKEIELSYDRNSKEYYLTFYRGKPLDFSPKKFQFDCMEHNSLLHSKIDAFSSITALEQIPSFDIFSAYEGMTPRLLD